MLQVPMGHWNSLSAAPMAVGTLKDLSFQVAFS